MSKLGVTEIILIWRGIGLSHIKNYKKDNILTHTTETKIIIYSIAWTWVATIHQYRRKPDVVLKWGVKPISHLLFATKAIEQQQHMNQSLLQQHPAQMKLLLCCRHSIQNNCNFLKPNENCTDFILIKEKATWNLKQKKNW